MDTQDKYNKWFKSMADKYLLNYSYDIEERSENDTTYLVATIKHTSDSEKNIEISYAMASDDIDDHLNRKEHKKIIKSWSGKYDRVIEEN